MSETKAAGTELVSESIFQYIREQIIAGKWPQGTKIPSEMKLCEQLHVSRVSVRTAINRLACMGVLESQKGKGTFVCSEHSIQPIDKIYSSMTLFRVDRLSTFEYRKVIEAASAEFAASRATTQMVDEMSRSVLRMQETTDPAEILRYDLNFHYLVAKSTGNELIIRTFEILQKAYIRQFQENIAIMGGEGVKGHQKILSAIEVRDGDLARRAMLEHLDFAARRVMELRLNDERNIVVQT